MARPIKETPTVYGKDARRILKEMENPEPLPAERVAEILRHGELHRQQKYHTYSEYLAHGRRKL
jgi:hypothetical protein